MAEAFGLTCCSFGLVPKSKLLHRPKVHHGFILKLSHHRGENTSLTSSQTSKTSYTTRRLGAKESTRGWSGGIYRTANSFVLAAPRGKND